MLTKAESPVDATPPEAMWPISRIAARDHISKQAVSKRVKAFAAAHDLAVLRNGRGHITALNVVQYDRLRGQFGDIAKDQRPQPASANDLPDGDDSYNEARRVQGWLEVEARRLDLAKVRGELVPASAVALAIADSAAEIVKAIERMPAMADDFAAAVSRDGSPGLRLMLKQYAEKLRAEIADALDAIARTTSAALAADQVAP